MTGHARKPRWVTALSALLWLNTAGMPLQVILLYGHAPTEAAAIWAKLALQNKLVMLLSPLAALGVGRVCRWGWWAAVAFFGAAAANNLVLLRYPSPYPFAAVLLGTVVLLAALAWFGVPEVVRLYGSPGLHWWKPAPRYSLATGVGIETRDRGEVAAVSFNVSRTGLFVRTGAGALAAGDTVRLRLWLGARAIRCAASVVRIAPACASYPAGYGLRFHGLSLADRLFLRFGLAAAVT